MREARERRGLSLRQVAEATKIGMATLKAIEENQISRLPGGIFSRGFVRSYAAALGLDPEAALVDFMAQFPHDTVTAGHPVLSPVEDREATESNRRIAGTVALLIAISVPLAAALIYFGMERRTDPARRASSQTEAKP